MDTLPANNRSAIFFDSVAFSYDKKMMSRYTAASDDMAYSDAKAHLDTRVLADVSLTIIKGEFVALLGANGSGKSTLARHINALLLPDSGTVLVCGMSTNDPELLFEIRSRAGMVFQNPDSQIVAGIVADDVAFGPENLCIEHDSIIALVDDSLATVGMTEFARRDPAHLSGGQKQRVCIAGVLAMQPEVLVLDEPGAMLDQRGRRGIRRVMKELHDQGMTIVLVTHYMEEAALADRIVVLEKGRVAFDGLPREIFTHSKELRHLGLGLPFSVLLAEEFRARGLTVPTVVRPRELRAYLGKVYGKLIKSRTPDVPMAAMVSQMPQQQAVLQPMSATRPIIVLRNVSYTYPEAKEFALNDINISIDKGSLTAIIGHSGSGKSTLMQLICGLEQPSDGSITINDKDLANREVRLAIHSQVAIAFQYPEHQLFAATVADDIAFAPRNAALDEQEVDAAVRLAFDQVALDYDSFASRSPFSLSGGEKRRVALAGVLAQDTDIIIFDEPTTGLDPRTHQLILAMIARLHAAGKTVILVTHDIDDVAILAERIVVLNKGKVVLDGTPQNVFLQADELRAINLGVPQATDFAHKLALEYGSEFGHLSQSVFLDSGDLVNSILATSPSTTSSTRVAGDEHSTLGGAMS